MDFIVTLSRIIFSEKKKKVKCFFAEMLKTKEAVLCCFVHIFVFQKEHEMY